MFKTARALHGPKSAHTRTASRSKGQSLGSVRPRLPSFFCSSLYIYKENENHKRGCSAVVAGVSVERAQGFSAPLFQLFTILTLQCRV